MSDIPEINYLKKLGIDIFQIYNNGIYFFYDGCFCRLRLKENVRDSCNYKFESYAFDLFYKKIKKAIRFTCSTINIRKLNNFIKLFKKDISKHKLYKIDGFYFTVIGCPFGVIECYY